MMRKALSFCMAVLLWPNLWAQQDGMAPKGRSFVSFEPMASVTVKGKQPTPVQFTFRVQPGYHINSNQPSSEELIPTQLHFSLPGDLVIGKVEYPAGKLTSFPFDPQQKLSVYSGDVVIKALVLAQADASPGAHTVHGELRYQACDNNACYPPKKLPIEFDVKIASATTAGSHKSGRNPQSPNIR
jgi:DsbC/DsbD-like thiol-disulfide interchange protein